MSVFAAAIDVLFADPNLGMDAVYRAHGADPAVAVRAMISRPDRIGDWGETRIAAATCTIEVRASEVAAPAAGDTVEIAGETFVILATPLRDVERLVWSMACRPT